VLLMFCSGSQKTSTDRSVSTGAAEAAAVSTSSARPGVVAEYCEREYFDADCSVTGDANRLIVMRSAVFGRMKEGRCVQREYGSIGCRADVLAAVSRLCSGRRRCRFLPSTLHSATTRPCPTELVSYLEARFDCVTGSSLTSHCANTNQIYYAAILCRTTRLAFQSVCPSVPHWLIFSKTEKSLGTKLV